MMPESLKQLQDRLENYVEKIKTRRGEIQDVSSQYNFDINRTYSFNLAEIIRELTKMPDERVTKLKHFSAYAMKIFPLLTQATDQEMKRRNLQQKIDDMEKEIVAKFKRKQKQREKKRNKLTNKLKLYELVDKTLKMIRTTICKMICKKICKKIQKMIQQ